MWTQSADYSVSAYLVAAFSAFVAGVVNRNTRKPTLKITAIMIGAIVIILPVTLVLFVTSIKSHHLLLGIPIIALLGFAAFVLIKKMLAKPMESLIQEGLREDVSEQRTTGFKKRSYWGKQAKAANDPVPKKVWIVLIFYILVMALLLLIIAFHTHNFLLDL